MEESAKVRRLQRFIGTDDSNEKVDETYSATVRRIMESQDPEWAHYHDMVEWYNQRAMQYRKSKHIQCCDKYDRWNSITNQPERMSTPAERALDYDRTTLEPAERKARREFEHRFAQQDYHTTAPEEFREAVVKEAYNVQFGEVPWKHVVDFTNPTWTTKKQEKVVGQSRPVSERDIARWTDWSHSSGYIVSELNPEDLEALQDEDRDDSEAMQVYTTNLPLEGLQRAPTVLPFAPELNLCGFSVSKRYSKAREQERKLYIGGVYVWNMAKNGRDAFTATKVKNLKGDWVIVENLAQYLAAVVGLSEQTIRNYSRAYKKARDASELPDTIKLEISGDWVIRDDGEEHWQSPWETCDGFRSCNLWHTSFLAKMDGAWMGKFIKLRVEADRLGKLVKGPRAYFPKAVEPAPIPGTYVWETCPSDISKRCMEEWLKECEERRRHVPSTFHNSVPHRTRAISPEERDYRNSKYKPYQIPHKALDVEFFEKYTYSKSLGLAWVDRMLNPPYRANPHYWIDEVERVIEGDYLGKAAKSISKDAARIEITSSGWKSKPRQNLPRSDYHYEQRPYPQMTPEDWVMRQARVAAGSEYRMRKYRNGTLKGVVDGRELRDFERMLDMQALEPREDGVYTWSGHSKRTELWSVEGHLYWVPWVPAGRTGEYQAPGCP